MSSYYRNYSQYLGAQRCCDSRGPGQLARLELSQLHKQ